MNLFRLPCRWTLCIVGILAALYSTASLAQLSGAGSTLARELMIRWASTQGAASGGVTYDATGSTRGLERMRTNEIDFGVIDAPLTEADLRQSNLKQIPLAATGVAIAVNIPELAGQTLKLNGDTLANIYTGRIEKWNHSQIAGSNPGVKLPDRAIVPIWRVDGSGQSYLLSSYLSRNNTAWRRLIGTTNLLKGLAGRNVTGGAAMVASVKATPGAIGYDSYGAVKTAGLSIAAMRNASEQYVAPSTQSINEALSNARWSFGGAENAADLDASAGAGSYPLSAVVYGIVPAATARKDGAGYLIRAVQQGDADVTTAGFVPLPANAKTAVSALRR